MIKILVIRSIFIFLPTLLFLGCSNVSLSRTPSSEGVESCQKTLSRLATSNKKPRAISKIKKIESPDDLIIFHESNTPLTASYFLDAKLIPLFAREISNEELSLRNGKIIKVYKDNDVHDPFNPSNSILFDEGINQPRVVEFENGNRAIWKGVHNFPSWHSNYRAEVLAYEIDRLLGLNLVPATVSRKINGRIGSLQIYAPQALRSKNAKNGLHKQDFFDFIIENHDRHSENFLATSEGDVISIDHDNSFTGFGSLRNRFSFKEKELNIAKFIVTPEGQAVIARIQKIDFEKLQEELLSYLSEDDTERLIRRLQYILRYNEALLKYVSMS